MRGKFSVISCELLFLGKCTKVIHKGDVSRKFYSEWCRDLVSPHNSNLSLYDELKIQFGVSTSTSRF